MKKFLTIAVIIIVILGIWYLSGTHVKAPTTDNQTATTTTKNENVTMVDLGTTFNNPSVTGTYPQFKKASAGFNKNIADYVNKSAQEAITQGEENWNARLETATPEEKAMLAKETSHYTFSVEATPIIANDKFISVLINTYAFVGGAHGSAVVMCFNYDVANQKSMILSDLFPNDKQYLAKISASARTQLAAQFKKDFEGTDADFQTEVMDWVNTGTEPTVENFSVFTFTDKNVILYFQDYQVGPHSSGLSKITVPRP